MSTYDIALGKTLELLVGDITLQRVDAIVNAANGHLAHGGGVARAISIAAGPELQDASDRLVQSQGPVPTGQVAVTSGFKLPAQHVIHAVGPVWQGGNSGEAELLAACYRNSLRVADELHAARLAFPSISTGIFGYPVRDAADVALRSIVQTAPSLKHVRSVSFVLFSEDIHRVYAQAAEALKLVVAG